MNTTIEIELKQHILDYINDGVLTNENKDEWHYYAFNQDYYIIYHSKAIQWLKTHNLDAFQAIDIVREYETENFGKFNTRLNPKSIVNMIAYIYGEDIFLNYDYDIEIEELKSALINDLSTFDKRLRETDKDFVFFNTDTFGTILDYTFSNDYKRYKNKYDKFLTVEKAINIEINLSN